MRHVHAYGMADAWRSNCASPPTRSRHCATEAMQPKQQRRWTTAVGGMQGIAIDPATGVMTGGCDPRRDGFVAAA